MFEVDQSKEIGVDQSNQRIHRQIQLTMGRGSQVANALEDQPCLSSQHIERYNQSVLYSFFLVLHTSQQGCGFDEISHRFVEHCLILKEMSSAVHFIFFVCLTLLR